MFVIKQTYRNIKPPIGSKINLGHSLSNGLMGCWLFNEGLTAKIFDCARNNNGLKTGSIVPYPGKFGNTFSFPGAAGAKIQIPDSNDFTVIDFSICAWIKTSSATIQIIAEHQNISGSNFGFYVNSDGTLHGFALYSIGQDDGSGKVVNDGRWHFVSFVRNSATKLRYFYVDARFITSVSDTQIGVNDANATFMIGERFEGGETFPFNGLMDNVMFYNRALSYSEIQQLYIEPYCFVQPIRRRFISVGASGTTSAPSAIGAVRGSFLTLGVG